LERFLDGLCVHRYWVLGITVLVVAALAAGIGRLNFSNDTRAYFGPDNPQLLAFERLEDIFEKRDSIGILVVAEDGDIYDRRSLRLVRELTEFGWRIPYARRVKSLSNYQHTRAVGDELFVADLVGDTESLDAAKLLQIRAVVEREPLLLNNLVGADGSVTYVDVALAFPPGDLDSSDTVVDYVDARLGEFRRRYPQHRLYIHGSAPLNVSLGDAVKRDLKSLVLLSFVVIVSALSLMLRHVGGTLAVLLVVALSVVATMGLFGWIGFTLEAVAGFVPSVVMTIAVADAVHILSTCYYELRRRRDRTGAVREALRVNAAPVLITTLTTAIGVLTLNFSDSPPYRELGNMIAVGVVFAYIFTMTFLPALLLVMPIHHRRRGRRLELLMNELADTIVARRSYLLLGIGALVVLLASFIPSNQLTERWHEYFDDSFEIRVATDIINERLGGAHVIQYVLDTGIDQGINNPEYLRLLDNFTSWYLNQPGVRHVAGLGDFLKRLNMNLHGDDPAYYRAPDSPDQVAQYLLLYELSLPLGLGLDNMINVSRSATRFTVFVEKTDSRDLIEMDERAQAWLASEAPVVLPGRGSGLDMMFAHINDRNIRGLLKGMVVALILISFLLLVVLRSLKLGLLSLLSNLAPAGLAYGTWGIFVGWIDLSASVVICMSIGIVVDDTVHFLSKYLRARRNRGMNASAAMRYAFNTVGVALVITTIVLVAGFLVLAASHFSPTRTTGLLMAMTLSYALLIDFLFLPPLLMLVDRR
jgi:predicted RND superfamily exporter protein